MKSIEIDAILSAVRAVGDDLLARYQEAQPVIGHDDMMTAFHALDGMAAAELRTRLHEHFPAVHWHDGELEGAQAWDHPPAGAYWVCDAMDGAVQYLRHLPCWCVSLTLVEHGQATAAVIYDAAHGEMFHAIRDQGAFCNGSPIYTNEREHHLGALLTTSQPPFAQNDQDGHRKAGEAMRVLLGQAGAIRNFGPTSLQLAHVAAGRLDGFWEFGEDTFNCLGGALFVTEAGGIATDSHGAPYALGADSILAAPRAVHRSLSPTFAAL